MLKIYRFLRGSVKVRFYGEFNEKILNLFAFYGIPIGDSRLIGKDIEASVYLSDFKKLRGIMRGSGIRLKIIKKSGLPFIINRYRHRFGILTGVILALVFLKIMSGYIWIIDVVGNDKTDTDTIIGICEEIGIHEGIKASEISPKIAREELLIKSDTLAWASLNIEGSRLTVNVSEAKNNVTEKEPSNIVAAADGIITKIDIKSGNCLVKPGDVVKKGDILVSGIIEDGNGTRFVHSAGTVFAEVRDEISLSEAYCQIKSIETGERKHKKLLRFFSLNIPLYLGEETRDYESTLTKNELKLMGSRLPIALYDKEFRYKTKITLNLSRQESEERLLEKFDKILSDSYPDSTEIKEKSITDTGDGLLLRAAVISVRSIGEEEKINIQ